MSYNVSPRQENHARTKIQTEIDVVKDNQLSIEMIQNINDAYVWQAFNYYTPENTLVMPSFNASRMTRATVSAATPTPMDRKLRTPDYTLVNTGFNDTYLRCLFA